jgi:hypothetical protein
MDEEMLAEARRAEERLIDAERDAEVFRAEFHRAVRRLHLNGASLRELAGALGLSHQRVHQIVESAGGSRRWLRHRVPGRHDPGRPADRLVCTFCGQDQAQARKLIAGPHVCICDACVPRAREVISSGPVSGGLFVPVMPERGRPESEPRPRMACSFCGKQLRQVAGLAATSAPPPARSAPPPAGSIPTGRPAICTECLDLCDEILDEDLSEDADPS